MSEMMSANRIFGKRPSGWLHKIEIKQYLNDDDSDENAVKTAEKVLEVLESNSLFVGVMISEAGRAALETIQVYFANVRTCNDFNEALDSLYDFGDTHRIWIG